MISETVFFVFYSKDERFVSQKRYQLTIHFCHISVGFSVMVSSNKMIKWKMNDQILGFQFSCLEIIFDLQKKFLSVYSDEQFQRL